MMAIAACGGGGDGGSPKAIEPLVQIANVGDARIEKTILPGVIQFSAGDITQIDDTTLKIISPPNGFKNGSVFTWQDHAYVASAVNQSDGATVITVRQAEFAEVLSDIAIHGTLSMADIDPNSLTWEESPDLAASTPASVQSTQAAVSPKLLATTSTSSKASCKVAGEADSAVKDDISCTFARTFQDAIAYTGTIGLKKMKFNSMNLHYKENTFSLGSISGSLYAETGVEVVNEKNEAQEIKLDIPLVRVHVAVPQTLGFVRAEIPMGINFGLPQFKLRASASVEIPLDSPSSLTATIHTPVATTNTDLVVKYEASDAFAGPKVGIELVVGVPPLQSVQWLSDAKENSEGRLLALGAFYKFGYGGLLSMDASAEGYCFKYDLQAQSGYAFEASGQLGSLSTKAKWETIQNRLSAKGKIEGENGTSCQPTGMSWHATFHIDSCDAIRVFGSGYACNAHGGWGFGSWTDGAFWLTDGNATTNNMLYAWQINDGTFTGYELKSVPFNTTTSNSFDIPVRHKALPFDYQYSAGQSSPFVVKHWDGYDEINLLRFVITERTPTSLKGTFSSSNSYYRYTDEAFSNIYSHLELGTAHPSGTWSATRSEMPKLTGSEGYDGCGYIQVTNVWLAYNLIETGRVTETGPPCAIISGAKKGSP